MEATDSRTAIKGLALDLLVRKGYRGMGFAEIAGTLGITRANIHYHFGSKDGLIDEVLADYVETTLVRLALIWEDDGTSLSQKLDATLAHSRERFRHFNPGSGAPRPWSLISRLRQDEALLSAAGARNCTSRRSCRPSRARLAHAAAAGECAPTSITPAAASALFVVIADNAPSPWRRTASAASTPMPASPSSPARPPPGRQRAAKDRSRP